MKFTRTSHSVDTVISNFELLMSHMQRLISKGAQDGQHKLIRNTKFGELHGKLKSIDSLSDVEAAELALLVSSYNQVNYLFDESLDISFHEHEVLDLITGQSLLSGVNDKSSDRLFELSMAVRFARGWDGKSRINLDTECDIIIDSKLAIECKNIQSAKKVKPRVKYASQQLECRFAEGLAEFGFIAVDVSAVLDREKISDFTQSLFDRFKNNYSVMAGSGSYAPLIRQYGVVRSIEMDGNFQNIITSYVAHQAEFAFHSNLGDFRLEHLPRNCWGIIIQSRVPLIVSSDEKRVPISVRAISYFLNPSFPEELKESMRFFLGKLSTGF